MPMKINWWTLLVGVAFGSFSFAPIILMYFQVGASSEVSVSRGKMEFSTSIPMYYINLERSIARRQYMEESFKRFGSLTRIKAIDGSNLLELQQYVEPILASRRMSLVEYLTELNVTSGELALTLSHLRAIQAAWRDSCEFAIVLEDDASLVLTPFWTETIEELVDLAENVQPDWNVLRLQYTSAGTRTYRESFRRWRLEEGESKGRIQQGRNSNYGMVAYLIRRRGMEQLINKFYVDGTFDCWRRVQRVRCAADLLLPKEIDGVYRVYPPLFTYRMMEDGTGVRSERKSRSDNWQFHEQSIADSVRVSLEHFERNQIRKLQIETFESWSNRSNDVDDLDKPISRWKLDFKDKK